MSEEHPVDEPASAAPTWAALPTMPWTRVVPAPRAPEPEPALESQPEYQRDYEYQAQYRPDRRSTDREYRRPTEYARPEYARPEYTRPERPADERSAQERSAQERPAQERPRPEPPAAKAERGWFDAAAREPSALTRPTGGFSSFDPLGPITPIGPITTSGPILPPGPVSAIPVSPDLSPPTRPPARPVEADPPPTVETAEPGPPLDPEQVLAAYQWRFDPDTLQEVVSGDEVDELIEVRDLLTAKLEGKADNPTRARLLSLRAVVSRILGETHKALADGKLALAHAEATGELRRVSIAQARLAHVLQWTGDYSEADRLFALANSPELPDRLRATMHQHAGKCAYDQGRYIEACNHFEQALELRKEEDPEMIAQTALALDAVFRRVAERGWGPYPRPEEEILKIRKAPSPYYDEVVQRWGYLDDEAEYVVDPVYSDAQPFRDGAAWVQHPGTEAWELIDEDGGVLIPRTTGYLGVRSFSDGLAWVSHDGNANWIAIDKSNTTLISTGFTDVRPFRRGVAAVRRGPRWGAVDAVGRVVVPFLYDGFATALHDGRYIDGFNDEGLAVVTQGGRRGVVDRAGRVLVPPTYSILVIHPVAFLYVDPAQRWGALDRKGQHLIAPKFPSRVAVADEIDRLLADTRPML